MSKVTLSVVIPVYNEAKTIGQVLQKLSKESVVSEIVIVDDGSQDGTASIVKKSKDKKIKYFYKDNGGKGSAVRFGLAKVTGEYVLIQDADLEYDPEDIGGLIDPIQKQKATVVYGLAF